MNKEIIKKVKGYLNDTLSVSVSIIEYRDRTRLPFFISESYQLYQMELFGQIYILMMPGKDESPTPGALDKHTKILSEKTKLNVIYLNSAITSSNRQRLIKHKISFIIPGNQMYLPELGIDLREHFRILRAGNVSLSPSSQVLLLYIITKDGSEGKTSTEYSELLGYSKMTLSRSFEELKKSGFVNIERKGKECNLQLNMEKKELWQTALPFLKSPVKKEFFVKCNDKKIFSTMSIAEFCALSKYTMISSPEIDVYAAGSEEFGSLRKRKKIDVVENKEEADAKIQIWKYYPGLLRNTDNNTVDKFSLYLSLMQNNDERVEACLEELLKGVRW